MMYEPRRAARPTMAGQNPLARPLTPGEYAQLTRVAMARASWLLRDHAAALETQIREERERLAEEREALTADYATLRDELVELRKVRNRAQQRLSHTRQRCETFEEDIAVLRRSLRTLEAERELLSRAVGERTEEVTDLRTKMGTVAGHEGLEVAVAEATRLSRTRHGLGRKHKNAA